MEVMNQPGLNVSAYLSFDLEEILVAFLGLLHLGISLAFFVPGRAVSTNNGRLVDDSLVRRQAFPLQITVDHREDRRGQLMLFQHAPEVHDCGVFRDRRAQCEAR